MQDKRPQIDVVNEILEDCLMAFPVHGLLISLYQQYQRRGFLTKKQLQALHIKASQVPDIAPGKLATLEALINKMPNRFKSEIPKPAPETDETAAYKTLIEEILARYPEHKRVRYFQSRVDAREPLSAAEVAELKRFHKLLNK
jgi:hypothetical protein